MSEHGLTLLDKLKAVGPEDLGRDVREFLGLGPADRVEFGPGFLRINGEAVVSPDVVGADLGAGRPGPPRPSRARYLRIKDLG